MAEGFFHTRLNILINHPKTHCCPLQYDSDSICCKTQLALFWNSFNERAFNYKIHHNLNNGTKTAFFHIVKLDITLLIQNVSITNRNNSRIQLPMRPAWRTPLYWYQQMKPDSNRLTPCSPAQRYITLVIQQKTRKKRDRIASVPTETETSKLFQI